MPSENCGLSARSLAELALVVSRMSRRILDESAVPCERSLRLFWRSTRALQQRWMMVLDDWTTSDDQDVVLLERLSSRVFTCEMLVRTWSTVLASLAHCQGSDDLTRLSRNAVNGLMQIRIGILSRLVTAPDADTNRLLEIDRMRRRCDRWTDLLLGHVAVKGNCFEFAVNEERAREFGEESLIADPATGPHVVEHLVSAGLRLTFVQYLTTSSFDEPEFVGLTQSILSSIPRQCFHQDGTLRSLLERRIAVSRRRNDERGCGSAGIMGQDEEASKRKPIHGDSAAKKRRYE